MKRYVEELVSLYKALLLDAVYAFPALEAEFERDLVRLTHLSNCRGLPFFMVDLPALGKHLDRCLSNGKYIPSGLPASQPVGGGVGIPKLFRGLYLLLFDECGNLKEHVDVEALVFLRQFLYCAKKASIQCSDHARLREIQDFVDTDSSLPRPVEAWTAPTMSALQVAHTGFAACESALHVLSDRVSRPVATRMLRYLDLIAGVISTTLGPFDWSEWRFRHGPGAVSDVFPVIGRKPDKNRYLLRNWSERLETAFPVADVAHSNYVAWADETRLDVRGSIEPSSRLIAVAKTLTKPRLIASEPSEHMWCQQNVRDYMYSRCASTWIGSFVTFRSQEANQAMALQGSRDGSFATIDLSAASDRVSCQVVGNLFRRNLSLLQALASTRTQSCIVSDELTIEVRKYSTMGNATTFPVQTLIFLTVALSCLAERDGLRMITPHTLSKYSGLVSIFGDDIIVPEAVAHHVVDLLEALGFKVNTAKSYLTGPFKESCGVDAFRGHDVTPAYWQGPCDRTPESIASCVEVANNFYKKFMVNASAFIERGCRVRVPYRHVGAGGFGYDCFLKPPIRFPSRWNKGLQRTECRVPILKSTCELHDRNRETSLLQFFTEDPSPTDPWEAGVRSRPLLKLQKGWVPTAQFTEP